ncbi:MAG: hypothetical protein WA431_04295 [Candidatus Cybelea sp.]
MMPLSTAMRRAVTDAPEHRYADNNRAARDQTMYSSEAVNFMGTSLALGSYGGGYPIRLDDP